MQTWSRWRTSSRNAWTITGKHSITTLWWIHRSLRRRSKYSRSSGNKLRVRGTPSRLQTRNLMMLRRSYLIWGTKLRWTLVDNRLSTSKSESLSLIQNWASTQRIISLTSLICRIEHIKEVMDRIRVLGFIHPSFIWDWDLNPKRTCWFKRAKLSSQPIMTENWRAPIEGRSSSTRPSEMHRQKIS